MDSAIDIIRAHRPWYWGEPTYNRIRKDDPQDQIDKCLNCKHAKCIDCLSGNYKPRTRPIKERHAEATRKDYSLTIPYLTGEKTAAVLAVELGIGDSTVRDWAKKYLQLKVDASGHK